MKKIQIISLFPEMFEGVLHNSMMWKAQQENVVSFELINLRDFGLGPRKQVDDMPYGGGDGMLLKPEPLFAAIEKAKQNDPTAVVVLPTPRGKLWKQSIAQEWSELSTGLIFVCARYEGYDERVTEVIDEQVRVGDYVLTGGELPAMTIIDSIVRLMPGVLGGETSAEIESFADGQTLEFPQYTRPEDFEGRKVPEVLLSGHHGEIAKWRAANSKMISPAQVVMSASMMVGETVADDPGRAPTSRKFKRIPGTSKATSTSQIKKINAVMFIAFRMPYTSYEKVSLHEYSRPVNYMQR